jgi:hypothetical protein
MRKQIKTERATKQVAEQLNDLYGYGNLRGDQSSRLILSRQLNHLAELAGVARVVTQTRAELYLAIVATGKLDGAPR